MLYPVVRRALAHLSILLIFLIPGAPTAFAQTLTGPTCAAPWRVDQTLANGARWQMCWERRLREGIVLQDVFFTNTAGVTRRVLAEAAVAQIHVPYDDNMARYHDVSDYGLGKDQYINALTQAECPGGQLLNDGTRNVVCRQTLIVSSEGVLGSDASVESSLVLFSVSHVGAYNYIPQWTFYDDGTIEPAMGATGRLQRYGTNVDHGWSINATSSNHVGVSHLHNYYWKLDFDLGDDGTDDIFEEIDVVTKSDGTRETEITQFNIETARRFAPAMHRSWRIKDGAIQNATGAPVSYEIRSLDTGHSDVGPSYEPWTSNDIYLTRVRPCERFASHNPADIPGGCNQNGHLASFANGESVTGEDQVVWFGLSFHHIPRDEDEPYMHAHWNRFEIIPRDWNDAVAPSPVIVPPAPLDPVVITQDFESSHDWTLRNGPDARSASGAFAASRQHRTSHGARTIQPGAAASGMRALVTGPRRGQDVSTYALNAGWTTAISPPIQLPQGTSATLDFEWFFSHGPTATAADELQITVVSDSGEQRVLNARGRSRWRPGVWRSRRVDISSHAGQTVRIRVQAANRAAPGLIEAGFDAMRITVQP